MSSEHPCLTGTITGIANNHAYAFVNNPIAINGYTGKVPSSVFVHANALGKERLVEGMRVEFDARPSKKQKHAGRYEAHNVKTLHASQSLV